MEAYLRGGGVPRHRPLLTALRRSCFALLLAPGLAAAASSERGFGVVPQLSPIVTAERWQPLLNEVSRQAGVSLRFATASGITKFEERVLAGEYDFVYLNSLLFQEAQKSRGYRALVRDEQPLRGIIVVRQDGPQSLAELSGKTLAFPSPRAFGATLLTRADLKRLNIPHDVSYLGTHESVYQAVAQGRHVAGGGALRSFELLAAAQRRGLRILHTTAPVMAHVIAVHPRVPAPEAERVRQTLLKLHEQPVGAVQLGKLDMRRLVAVVPADFESVRGYSLTPRIRALAFHVIPRLDVEATRQHMQPLAAYMKQRLDLDVQLKTYADMAAFEKAIYATNTPSLVNANPLYAIRLIKQGFEVIAQQMPVNAPEGMRSLILVRADSPYQRLEDLRDKPIAFGGNPNAFFTTVVPKAMLRRAGLEGRYIVVTTPGAASNVLPLLAEGKVEAAGSGLGMFNNEALRKQYIEGRMRVLAQSDLLPGHAWLVGPKLDPELRDELRHFLLNFGADAPGHAAMQAAGIERLVAADNTSYAVVRPYLEQAGN